MHLTTALVAAFVATSSAFLVPPHFSDDFKDTRFRGGPPEHVKEFIHHLLEERTTNIDLKCHDCPFALLASNEAGEYFEWSNEPVDSNIHLEFTTEGGILNLNGQPLYPYEKVLEMPPRDQVGIVAEQRAEAMNKVTKNIPLEFAMGTEEPIPSPHKDGVFLHKIEFTVLGLDGMPVKTNTLVLKLVQIPTGDLVLVRSDEVPLDKTSSAEICEGAAPWSFCRMRAMIVAKLRTMLKAAQGPIDNVHGWTKAKIHRGCHGKRPHGAWRHPSHEENEGEHRHHRGPHGHHRHHGKHDGQRYHRVSHMFHQTFRFFVIPALLGVIGGLVASAVGMLVGQAIILIWFRTYRQGRRGPVRVTREVVVGEDEKDDLLDEQADEPPVYKDAPADNDSMACDVEAEAEVVTAGNDEKH